jgi:hypothetical protein
LRGEFLKKKRFKHANLKSFITSRPGVATSTKMQRRQAAEDRYGWRKLVDSLCPREGRYAQEEEAA